VRVSARPHLGSAAGDRDSRRNQLSAPRPGLCALTRASLARVPLPAQPPSSPPSLGKRAEKGTQGQRPQGAITSALQKSGDLSNTVIQCFIFSTARGTRPAASSRSRAGALHLLSVPSLTAGLRHKNACGGFAVFKKPWCIGFKEEDLVSGAGREGQESDAELRRSASRRFRARRECRRHSRSPSCAKRSPCAGFRPPWHQCTARRKHWCHWGLWHSDRCGLGPSQNGAQQTREIYSCVQDGQRGETPECCPAGS